MKYISLILLLSFFSLSSFANQTVYIMKTKAVGTDAGTTETVHELIKSAVDDTDGFTTTDSKSGASVLLKSKVLKLGNAYIVTVYKKSDGKTTNKKLKANTLEDLDVVIPRVVKAALGGMKAKKTVEVDTVTDHEVNEGTRRKKAVQQNVWGFGPGDSSNLNVDSKSYFVFYGRSFVLDPKTSLLISFEWLEADGPDTARFYTASMGANYYFSKASSTPFVNANFGYSVISAHEDAGFLGTSDDTANGFTLGLGAGYMFARVSEVNIAVALSYRHSFESTTVSDKKPSMVALALTLYMPR